jgi:hypothetical protein
MKRVGQNMAKAKFTTLQGTMYTYLQIIREL